MLYPVNFCGSGGECAGSIGNRTHSNCPTCGAEVNFKENRMGYHHGYREDAKYFVSEKKGNNKALKWIVGLSVATIAGIVGLGKGFQPMLSKLKDGKFKDFIKKAEPVANKCKDWCGTVQTKSVECWNKIKNTFSKKP